MAHVLIAGCGYVGSEVAKRLLAQGHQVVGLRRAPTKLPPGVRAWTADLEDRAALDRVEPRFDAVVYAAGPEATTEEAYRRTYLVGLANVLGTVGRAARRIVVTSSTAVYGQRDGEWVDESSATEPDHFSGRVLVEAERAAWRERPDTVVVRLAGIYGPGRASLLERIRRGQVAASPTAQRIVNRIHRDDCATALLHLLTLPEPERVYLAVDDEPCSQETVQRWLADRLGVRLDQGDGVSEPRPARRGDSSKRCSNARLRASGWTPCFPSYREGYAALIDDQKLP